MMPHFPTEMGHLLRSPAVETFSALLPGRLMARIWLTFALVLVSWVGQAAGTDRAASDFRSFLDELWPQAQARGVSRTTFDAAFAGVEPDPRVLAVTRRQPEYAKPFGTYINAFLSRGRIAAGRRNAVRWNDMLAAVETKYGVDRFVILSIWGAESDYGAETPRWNVIRSLATLAQARYRNDLFRDELLAALQILQDGRVARDLMVGSWAGAMGQCQFLPSSFLQWAVDFSGDGQRDIWTNVPDVLASIAHYLRGHGWMPGLPWGFEVVVPREFDYRISRGSFPEWAARGVRRADGGVLPDQHDAILFFPSGAGGPAFLVTDNFIAIKRYNDSDAYALAVAQLADRVRGLDPIRAMWPPDDVQLSRDQRISMQRGLAQLGYKVADFQGHIDFDLRDAIRDVQSKAGRVADGHADRGVLELILSHAQSQSAATKKSP
jgi:membrane-bound lytic murein transglycosylase B